MAHGADVLVMGAGSQSNFCRQATAAACKAGLDIQLILQHGVKGPERQGNLLLDELMGADITIVDVAKVFATIEEWRGTAMTWGKLQREGKI